jgi:tetratricopeptide (TPR) repeat protein
LRGRYYWNQRSGTGLSSAIDSFNEALEIEPDYPEALAGLADSWLLLPLYRAVEPVMAIPLARGAAERALAINPELSHAHAVIGVIYMKYDWNWSKAETHLRHAVTLNPNDTTAVQRLGELYCYTARFEECRHNYSTAAGLDPLSPVLRFLQGSPDLYSGRYESAVRSYLGTLNDMPDFKFVHIGLGHAYVGLEEWDKAIASYEALLPDYGLEIAGGPLIYARTRKGELHIAKKLLAELELLAQTQYVPPSKLALGYLALGEKQKALEFLHQAIEAHDDRLVYLAVDNLFVDIHSDAGFRSIAEQLNIVDVMKRRWGNQDMGTGTNNTRP